MLVQCNQTEKDMSSTPAPTTVPLKPCPSGWMSNGSFCYKMMPQSKTWTDARASCGSFGSNVDLVSIDSLAENAFVANAVLKNSAFAAWIGLSDRGVLYGKFIAVAIVRFGWNLLPYFVTSCNPSSKHAGC